MHIHWPCFITVCVMFVLVLWWGCCGRAPGQSRTWSLKVQRHHLAPSVPKDLRHVITGVHTASFGIDPAHLPLVIAVHWLMRKRHVGRCKWAEVIYNPTTGDWALFPMEILAARKEQAFKTSSKERPYRDKCESKETDLSCLAGERTKMALL